MTLQANASGVVVANITIPANVPAGSKRVAVTGAGGSRGEATYVGRTNIVTRELRQVTTQAIVRQGTDPLAQTFTLPESRLVGGVDVYFKAKGSAVQSNDVIVQIRGVTIGFPNDEILAEGIIPYASIVMDPAHTRATFPPVQLEANRPYAIVVLTDDAVHALSVAELGKFDSLSQSWVAAQAYQVGVLLSSSNAQTWTPHQDKDLKFRLLGAVFGQTSRTVNLGTLAVTNATDFVVLAGVERPTVSDDVAFEFLLDGGTVLTASERQAAVIAAPYTGNVQCRAKLKGSAKSSPILYGGVQALAGTVNLSNDYVTRAITVSGTTALSVTFERLTPGSSSVVVEYQKDGAGGWVAVPFDTGVQVGDGFSEVTHKLSGITGASFVKVRLTLNGTAAARPRVRKLRCITT